MAVRETSPRGTSTSRVKSPSKKTQGRKKTTAPVRSGDAGDKYSRGPKEQKSSSGFGGFVNNLRSTYNQVSDTAQGLAHTAGVVAKVGAGEAKRRVKSGIATAGVVAKIGVAQGKAKLDQLSAASKPLEFSETESKAGLRASGTLDRLAGQDQIWDSKDLANNFAQLSQGEGFFGKAKDRLVQNQLFDQHKVSRTEREGIVDQSEGIREANPGIARVRELRATDTSGLDKTQLAEHKAELQKHTSELGRKGLMPVETMELLQLGRASDNLKARLKDRGLPVPEGEPVDTQQYRGLFEGKSPLATQFPLAEKLGF